MKILTFFIACLLFFCAAAQKTDQRLQRKIEQIISGFHGEIGIYIKDLTTGKAITINEDTVFPTASIVKVPVLVGIMHKIQSGELQYQQDFEYRDSLYYSSGDILSAYKSGQKIPLKKLVLLMLSTSDNTASLWLQSISGGGERINTIMDSLGLKNTRVNSRTAGRENYRSIYGWGQTTPKEMAKLFEMIYRNKLFSPEACDRMMRCLGRNYWDINEAISEIPPYIEVFSKNGCVDASRNEVLLVNAPHHPYILSVFTKGNTDTSWNHDNEAWTIERKISELLWNYYEPKDNWKQPENEASFNQ